MNRTELTSEATVSRPEGKVVTVYSFEGGTGRTLMATNIGAMLANSGRSVLLVDFNFYSPGMDYLKQGPRGVSGHLADSWDAQTPQDVTRYLQDIPEASWRGSNLLVSGNIKNNTSTGRLALMPVWSTTEDIIEDDVSKAKRILSLLGKKNEGKIPNVLGFLYDMRKQWQLNFDYTLIDSPSGYDNVAGICTRLLADHVVLLSRTAGKGIRGTRDVISQIGSESAYGFPLSKTVIASMIVEGQFDPGQFAKALGVKADKTEFGILGVPFDIRMLVQDSPFMHDPSYVNVANRLLELEIFSQR